MVLDAPILMVEAELESSSSSCPFRHLESEAHAPEACAMTAKHKGGLNGASVIGGLKGPHSYLW